MKYPVISCSYITNEHDYFYSLEREGQKCPCRCVGWHFRPSMNDVVGIDPTDANIYAHNSTDEMEDFRSAMHNKFFVDDKKWLSGAYPTFQSCYPPIRMTEQKRFNEIVLRGNTEPDGVFIISFGESGEKKLGYYEQAMVAAKERRIPLVTYDYYKKELKVEQVKY